MTPRRRYRKRAGRAVTAVQVDLDIDGFTYRKWGGVQRCKRGDWLVDNAGDIYTVDAEVFSRTYRAIASGQYVKTTPVWAEVADHAGSVATREGTSHFAPGDYLVYNQEDGGDAYCMSADTFHELYESDD